VKAHNALIVVVDKLLTGFDEPTLHTLFIDRGMDDVLLFQAACRVNRWRKWKNDCLLVDFSHDGVVSKNLPKVFAKYGGLTVSSLDAMELKDKMDAAFKAFFDDKNINAHWRAWKATSSGGKDQEAATGLSDFLDGLVKNEIERAKTIRKAGSAWLSSRERLWGILDFTKPALAKHADEKRAAFAEQVVKHLASKLRDDDDRVGAVFDIDLVEDAVGWGLDEFPEAAEKKKKAKGEPGLPHSVGGLMASLDAIELLAALQLTEQQKLQLIEKLKSFLIALFQVIDNEGAKRNNDIHRKMILAMVNEGADFPWDERFTKFKSLLDTTATNLKILTHPDRKALLLPLLKRPELMMADYEEWVVSGGNSIVLESQSHAQVAGAVELGSIGLQSAMQRSADFLAKQLGDGPKWRQSNEAIWSAIQTSGQHALGLADIDVIAANGGFKQSELFAILGLLATPRSGFLKMEVRSGNGAEIPADVLASKLASWWRHKTMTEAEWKEWASKIEVLWTPSGRNGGEK
jgi:type I restriction enzyme R subunit